MPRTGRPRLVFVCSPSDCRRSTGPTRVESRCSSGFTTARLERSGPDTRFPVRAVPEAEGGRLELAYQVDVAVLRDLALQPGGPVDGVDEHSPRALIR